MKLLYLHQYFSLPSGSTGTRSYEFAKHLVSRGHKVTVLTSGYKVSNTGLSGDFKKGVRRGYVENNIEVIEIELQLSNNFSLLKRSWFFLRFVLKIIPIIFKENYDIIFATSTPLTVAVPGLFAKIFRKKTFIFEVRDLWPELPKAMGLISNIAILKILEKLASYTYKKADHIIGLSPGIIDGIKEYGIKENKLTLIPNGCDNNLFDAHPLKSIDGINNDDFVAIFAGAHGKANGLEILISVANELKGRNIKSIKFLLIGDGMLKKSLIADTRKHKLDNIIIFHDPVKKTELARIFKNCDMGLQLLANVEEFYYGTSPNKFFDYISAGLPVLNNYPGWLKDIINKNNCGIVVEPDNHIDFANKIIFASQNPDKLALMSKNAKKVAKNDFNRELLSNKFLKITEEVFQNNL